MFINKKCTGVIDCSIFGLIVDFSVEISIGIAIVGTEKYSIIIHMIP